MIRRGGALLVAVAAIALAASGCGESDREGDVLPTTDQGPVPGATEPGAKSTTAATTGTETSAQTAGTATNGEAAGPDPDPEVGREIFQSAGCGSCHTLSAAGSEGTVGPNLDDARPSFEQAVDQIANGGGGMPAFEDQLDEREIEDVAAFVVESTKG